jgi:hypothetical protein
MFLRLADVIKEAANSRRISNCYSKLAYFSALELFLQFVNDDLKESLCRNFGRKNTLLSILTP